MTSQHAAATVWSHMLSAFFILSSLVTAVKEVRTYNEFAHLINIEARGRPVIIDYFSDSCGPCQIIKPVFRRIANEYNGRAYFRTINVNVNRATCQQQAISSMPTFQFWHKGTRLHQFSGADEFALREWTNYVVAKADYEDSLVSQQSSLGSSGPKSTDSDDYNALSDGPALRKSTLEELRQELQDREDELEDQRTAEQEQKLATNPCSLTRNRTSGLVEKVVIIGGGPSGYTAAIYAARASLCPLVIAPQIGGQLLSKGVDVENYPGMPMENGGRMVQVMKKQARSFFAEVWDDTVVDVDLSQRPFRIWTNSSREVKSHTLIIATGAESRWLGVEGEYAYRGHGVSSCAVCDGALYSGRPCAVIGGGDTAMEEALYLARVCSLVTVIHRRGNFRASALLQERVLQNPNIEVLWHRTVASFHGKTEEVDGNNRTSLTHVMLRDESSSLGALETLEVGAAFVAIGHSPNTQFLAGTDMEKDSSGYIKLNGGARTTTPGVFAAGDVADHTYRQAVTSAGSGAMAALDAERYLSEHPPEEKTSVRQEDFSDWSLKEVVRTFRAWGMKCAGCTDKSEYVSKMRSVFCRDSMSCRE